MYELTIGTDIENIEWLEQIGNRLHDMFGKETVTACGIGKQSAVLCVGSDDKSFRSLAGKVKRVLIEFFLGPVKYEYIGMQVNALALPEASKKLLCHALTVFDRETETEILQDILKVGKTFCPDGFYRFRMWELRSRWDDICRLAKEHGAYLSDSETMNELLRFLVESGKQAGNVAEVFSLQGQYRLIVRGPLGDSDEHLYDSFEDLLCRLIDVSPSETLLCGFDYGSPFLILNAIFDAKCNILR